MKIGATDSPSYTIVVPTRGGRSLTLLLNDLEAQTGPPPKELVLVDDRPFGAQRAGVITPDRDGRCPVRVLRTGGRGAGAARNAGWRTAHTPWVVFLDDAVRLPREWALALLADLATARSDVGEVQGRRLSPTSLPHHANDREHGIEDDASGRRTSADIAYRRVALAVVNGFDERLPSPLCEDADLGLRIDGAGFRRVVGKRQVAPADTPAKWSAVTEVQRDITSEALMRALHGTRWRQRSGSVPSQLRRHLTTVATGLTAAGAALARRPRIATAAAAGCLALTAELTIRHIGSGPRPGQQGWAGDWARTLVTSPVLPWAAVWHLSSGELKYRHGATPWPPPVRVALLDTNSALIGGSDGNPVDVVDPVPQAAALVGRLQAAGLRLALVTTQSGTRQGESPQQASAVHARLEDLIGPFDSVPSTTEPGRDHREPSDQPVLRAADGFGVQAFECVVIGDSSHAVEAARVAGARSILVPTPVTRPAEVADADRVAATLPEVGEAVLELAGRRP